MEQPGKNINVDFSDVSWRAEEVASYPTYGFIFLFVVQDGYSLLCVEG